MKTKLSARFVVGHDGRDHVVHHDGVVIYQDDRITYVGADSDESVDETIDFGNAVISPGLIDLDAVADLDHIILDSWSSEDLRRGYQWSDSYFTGGRRDVFTPEQRRLIRRFALAQLLLHGVTTVMPIASEAHSSWAETYQDFVDMADEAIDLGVRAYLGPSYRGGVHVTRSDGTPDVMWSPEEGAAGLDGAARFAEYAADLHPLIRPVLVPCRIETMTRDLLERTAQLAHQHGLLVRLHCMQSMLELRLLEANHGATPMDLLQQVGLLNEKLLVPHGKYLSLESAGRPTDAELARFAASGASVVHCPLTEVRLGYTIDHYDRYRDAGIKIALGSDCFPPDLLRGMEYSTNLAKILQGRFDAAPAGDLFRAATVGGAQVLGRDDLGKLAPGAQADLTVIGFDDVRVGLVDDPIRTLMMHATARDVRMTVVAGRTVMRDGEIPGVDLVELRRQAQELFAVMRDAYTERDFLGRPAAQLFPPTFRLETGSTGS